MNDLFYPQERAILCDYFGIDRPAELRGLDVLAPTASDDDPEHPVLVEPNAEGEASRYGPANAVARLLLERVQSRLPQWVGRKDGEIVYGRKHRGAKKRRIDPLPQLLFRINWASSGPGFDWPETYNVIYVPGFGRFVVTASRDSTDLVGYTDTAIGWFDEGMDVLQGCRRVLLEWWKEFENYDPWESVGQTGLVSGRKARAWRDEAWRSPEPE
jgi:hypothetical protein